MKELETYKAGHFEKGTGYSYFVPGKINEQWIWKDAPLNTLLEKASKALGELNSYAKLVPNIELFIHLHVTKEAVISNRIEGTQTNINEALLPEDEISPERKDDWMEVKNYTEGLNFAINELENLPLSSRLLRKTHEILLQGVRGKFKTPGEYRTSQNWIGGASLADAKFIPPAVHYVDDLMSDLEKFLHNDHIQVPILVKAAIAHYQFETIHPFLDGNGRIGRLLITLYLVDQKVLEKPLLYLSAFFEKNKSLYYDNLTYVREKNDLLRWIKYFLIGIEETSIQAVKTLSEIIQMKQQKENLIRENLKRRTHTGLQLLEHLFIEPAITVSQVEIICNVSKKPAHELVRQFLELGILKELTGKKRYRIFLFKDYLDKFDSH